MALDDETNVVAFDANLVRELDRHFDEDLTRSVEVDLSQWEERSPAETLLEKSTTPLRRFF